MEHFKQRIVVITGLYCASSLIAMEHVKKVFSCVLCLDSIQDTDLQFGDKKELPAETENTPTSSEYNVTPRLTAVDYFHAKSEKKLLNKYPSLALPAKTCISQSSLTLLNEYLDGYSPDNVHVRQQQKEKIFLMLAILLQEKENFPRIKKMLRPRYMPNSCKETGFKIRKFPPGISDIYAYMLAVHQLQLKYMRPYKNPITVVMTESHDDKRPIHVSLGVCQKYLQYVHPIKLNIITTNNVEHPITISLVENPQNIGPHAASLIFQFLGDDFKYKQLTNILPCNKKSMRRGILEPQEFYNPLFFTRTTDDLIQDLLI